MIGRLASLAALAAGGWWLMDHGTHAVINLTSAAVSSDEAAIVAQAEETQEVASGTWASVNELGLPDYVRVTAAGADLGISVTVLNACERAVVALPGGPLPAGVWYKASDTLPCEPVVPASVQGWSQGARGGPSSVL